MMNNALYRLIYYSRNRIAGPTHEISAHIEAILEQSRSNNAAVGVTGALMFNIGCFAQVLEGPQPAVEATFERIQQDERHGEVSVLEFGPVEHRNFPNWSMAFVGASRTDATHYASIAEASGFDLSRMNSDQIQKTLVSLVEEEEYF
jgi:hypothetical protein